MLLEYVDPDDEWAGELLAADAETYGEPSLFARAVANNPAVLAARMEYVDALREAGSLDDRLAELVYATVAVANECEYCVASHTAQLVEHVGLADSEVDALVDWVRGIEAAGGSLPDTGPLTDAFAARERVVVAVALVAASTPNRLSSTAVDRLRAEGFDDADVVQLVGLVSAAVAANTVADALNVLPADEPDA